MVLEPDQTKATAAVPGGGEGKSHQRLYLFRRLGFGRIDLDRRGDAAARGKVAVDHQPSRFQLLGQIGVNAVYDFV